MSNSLRPHGLQPAQLLCPWNSPGKSTGMGCISFSRGSSRPSDRTQVSRFAGRFFTNWATGESKVDPSVNHACCFCCAFEESEDFPHITGDSVISGLVKISCLRPLIGISEVFSYKRVTPCGPDLAWSWIYHFHFMILDSWACPVLWVWGKLCTHCMIGTWSLNIIAWSTVNCSLSIKVQ